MIAVVQRVSEARVKVAGDEVSKIGMGLLVLLGVRKGDTAKDLEYMVRKITGLRIFGDDAGKMNLSIEDPGVKGEILAVSQFTLVGKVRKGRRPSFDAAEDPHAAESRFQAFVEALRDQSIPVKTGVFGAMMEVELINDGPVTFIVDSREKC